MLNAADFISLVTGKLDEHGVTKVIPDGDTLAKAWKRAHHVRRINRTIDSLHSGQKITLDDLYADVPPAPNDLYDRIEEAFGEDPTQTWDDVIWKLSGEQ
jgi:hypothetical protein